MNRDAFLPIIEEQLIETNSASLKGKGMDYAIKAFKNHLKEHFEEYGLEGGIY